MIQDNLYDFPRFGYNLLNSHNHLVHFTTTKNGGFSKANYGGFNLSLAVGEKEELVKKNRKLIARGIGIAEESLIFAFQVHRDNIALIYDQFLDMSGDDRHDFLQNTDALITNKREVCLCVLAADCGGVLLYDPIHKAIGAVHAGWRGVAMEITTKVVNKMVERFDSSPDQIIGAVAPCVGVHHYEIGDEVANAFHHVFGDDKNIVENNHAKPHVNIAAANRKLMLNAGLKPENIEIANSCTIDRNDLFYSARKGDLGRFCSGIMLR